MLKIIILLTVAHYFTAASIPPYIKVCKRNSPDLAGCIINSIYELKPKLAEGIPELNVPAIEPLPMGALEFRSGTQGAQMEVKLTNIKVWGPSTFEILELKPNLAKNRFAFKLKVPYLHFVANYDVDVNIILLKYKGNGHITGNFTNYQSDVVIKGHLIKIDGTDRLEFDKFDIHLHFGETYFDLDNLFEQIPSLKTAGNELLNENADFFANEVTPNIESALSEKFTEIANIISKKFPYEELFPVS